MAKSVEQAALAAHKPIKDCQEGSTYVEYLILVGFFALIVAGAVLALGEPLLSLYQHLQLVWAGPFP